MRLIILPPAPPAKTDSTRASMRGNKASNTKPELFLSQKLDEAGIKGYDVNCRVLPGTPDFAFLDAKLAVFVHGCFWHRCPYCNPHYPDSNKDYWSAKFLRNKRRDRRIQVRLRTIGWRPMVIWECQLKKDTARVLRRIIKATAGDRK